ncbi:MAG: hypothetical protein LC657_17180, partial [Desulfobacteraceae bacterium]|nr:hypothetical protein [Desulfobacteraceae bacterium]
GGKIPMSALFIITTLLVFSPWMIRNIAWTGNPVYPLYKQAFRPEYAAFQYANEHLAADAKIFGLYIGNRGYYSDRHIEFPIALLQKSAALAESGQDIAGMLHEKGFTHLLVNVSLFNFWVQKYSLHERQMLKQFFDAHTISVFSKDKHSLLRIR